MATNKKKSNVFLEILRFIVVGVFATIVDYAGKTGCAYALSKIWDTSVPLFSTLSLGISVLAGFALSVIVNYILSLLWVFQNAENKKSSGKRFWLFFVLGAIGWAMSEIIFYGSLYLLQNWSINIQAGNEALFASVKPETFWADVASLLSNRDFVAYTIVFVFSTCVVMVWNYLSRKKWIFASKSDENRIETDLEKEVEELREFNHRNGLKEIDAVSEEADAFAVLEKRETSKKAPTQKEKKTSNQATNKYEVFPEAGYFRYRLKSDAGEILTISRGYKSRKSAHEGIETLKKNVPNGASNIVFDKNHYSRWEIVTQNDARLIASGEFYTSEKDANNALGLFMNCYKADCVVDLDKIAEGEIRDWVVPFGEFKEKANGKIIYFFVPETNKWKAKLLASNGKTLFETHSSYTNKNGAIDDIFSIKNCFKEGSFHLIEDKQGRYQFAIFNSNGAILLCGEPCLFKNDAISAAVAAATFIDRAKEEG